jgi:hypothetical protein
MDNHINLGKAISYIFDDPDWLVKIGIMLAMNVAFGMLAVILVGFVFYAAQMGWLLELIRNMRVGDENPMPAWNNFGDKIQLGLGPLGATIVYSVIPGILGCMLFATAIFAGAASEEAAGVFGLGVICLLFPLLLAYAVVFGLMFTVGTINYSRTESISAYFDFNGVLSTVREHQQLTITYVVWVVVVNVGLSLAGSTGIGGLLAGAFATPILGHLLGQYALALAGGKKKKFAPAE